MPASYPAGHSGLIDETILAPAWSGPGALLAARRGMASPGCSGRYSGESTWSISFFWIGISHPNPDLRDP